ncbi:MAG: hypothetical protein HYV07_10575, partial [Deltaproteobacteria bacterium]|nr:hypothetical protein [Deltaproteobacteria bacterium]
RPVFLTEPPTSVRAGALYAYVPEVADPNGQSVTYTLDEAPIGMTVELSGRLLWVPGLYQLGSHQVTLRATDPDGNFELQTFVVEVVANAPPQITSIPPVSGTEARLYHYRVVAADLPTPIRVTCSPTSSSSRRTAPVSTAGY